MHHSEHAEKMAIEPLYAVVLLTGWILYLAAVFVSSKKHRPWPVYRSFLWSAGILCIMLALIGPLANLAHSNFIAHMAGHLLLGMLAPLLLVLAAPITLLLRTLSVPSARRLARLLKSRILFYLTHPITAAVLNIGGLWVLYTTDLYVYMHQNQLIATVVHLHIFLAGYLFTAALIYLDPMPHPFSFVYRSVVWILALAGHGILSKYIYANPPNGVSRAEAEAGGMLMYYGGDAIELLIIVILCAQWYKVTRPRIVA
ncbi:cytochrome c oxidase assembly protein [Planococcus shixiaomingii]|uniref:cytochrome c oxidase assembly protein n=1 Tax=Planococcus shixiaomingii TaxID=3058393 RepID=UPI0026262268|nr:cytochrome c oxidase assembly protein [Planococcus sp. N022]WKA54308.1 cytochrome c oxidase assembly protein [Planococcus sp. N022]